VIISHRHKFIFIKTRKTAGTSIEHFLLDHLGPDDAVIGGGRQNVHGRWNPTRELLSHPGPSNVKLTLKQWRTRELYYQHMPAWKIRARVGPAVWDEYFTFCFERDPWDKLVSFYFWRTRNQADDRPDFETWVRATRTVSGWPLYTIGDQPAVDFIGRYENLHDDLAQALERIGLDATVELPRDKSGFRPTDDEQVTFSPTLEDWVRREFRHEIALFGYDDRPRQPT
jgi:hypothetical protein